MIMKLHYVMASLSFFCLSNNAVAEEIKFTPRASLSISQYNFVQSERPNALAPTNINGNNFPEVKFNVTFKMLGIGGTFSKNGYYVDVFAQQSSKEKDTFNFDAANFSETFKGDRSDTSFTFGKKILDNKGALYIGYKTGKSAADGNQGQSLTFEEKGFFIGTNYAWLLSGGVLSLNVAYASLDGDLKEKVTANFGTLNQPLDTDATSDAQGISYGISYSANLSKHWNYSIGIDTQNYVFNNIKDANPSAIVSDKFTEKFVNTKLNMFYVF